MAFVDESTPQMEVPAWPGAVFLAVVYLLSTGWGFWFQPIVNPDEPRYAAAARDIVEGTGSWLIPRFNGEVRLKKPPLIYWALGACGKAGTALGLSTEAAFRLAPLLAGLVTVLSVYGLGRRLLNHRVGLFAGLLLIATPFVHSQWREIDTDPFLAAGLTAAWYFLVAALQRARQERAPSPWGWALGVCAAMALACLAKGAPLMFVFFALPALTYLIWSSPERPAGRSALRLATRMGLWWSIPLAVVIGSAWNILLTETAPAQSQGMAMESLRRFLGGVDHNKGLQMYPWLSYLMNVPHQLLPWSLFLLPLLVPAWREHREGFRRTLMAIAALLAPALILRLVGGATPEKSWQLLPYLIIAIALVAWSVTVAMVWARRIGPLSAQRKLLICAVAIPFLIMGLVGSKRDSYLLPIFPFLAIWVAQVWDGIMAAAERADPSRRGLIRAWTILAGVLAVCAALSPLGLALIDPLKLQSKVGFDLPSGVAAWAVVVGLAMACAAVYAIVELRAGRLSRVAVQVSLLVAAVLFVHEAALKPALNGREDRAAFYARIREATGSRPLIWFGGTANEAVYYCRRTVKRLVAFSEMEQSFFAVPNAVMVVRDKEFDNKADPAPALRAAVRELQRLPLGDKVYYLVEADPARSPLPEALKGKPAASDGSDGGG